MFNAEKMDREADRASAAVRARAESLIHLLDEIEGPGTVIDLEKSPKLPGITVACGECKPLILSQEELTHLHKGVMRMGERLDYFIRILRTRDEPHVKQTPS